MIESKGLSAHLGAAIIGAQLGFCHPPFPPFMDQFLRYCTTVATHKSLRFRIFIVACTLFLPYCLHLPARILKGKKRCGPLKLFLPHFLTLQCQNEVLRCCASFVPEREKMCVLLHLVSFHSTIIYSFFFLFALGDWRRRNFRFFFSYFRIYDKQKNKQTRKLKVSFRKRKKKRPDMSSAWWIIQLYTCFSFFFVEMHFLPLFLRNGNEQRIHVHNVFLVYTLFRETQKLACFTLQKKPLQSREKAVLSILCFNNFCTILLGEIVNPV